MSRGPSDSVERVTGRTRCLGGRAPRVPSSVGPVVAPTLGPGEQGSPPGRPPTARNVEVRPAHVVTTLHSRRDTHGPGIHRTGRDCERLGILAHTLPPQRPRVGRRPRAPRHTPTDKSAEGVRQPRPDVETPRTDGRDGEGQGRERAFPAHLVGPGRGGESRRRGRLGLQTGSLRVGTGPQAPVCRMVESVERPTTVVPVSLTLPVAHGQTFHPAPGRSKPNP